MVRARLAVDNMTTPAILECSLRVEVYAAGSELSDCGRETGVGSMKDRWHVGSCFRGDALTLYSTYRAVSPILFVLFNCSWLPNNWSWRLTFAKRDLLYSTCLFLAGHHKLNKQHIERSGCQGYCLD